MRNILLWWRPERGEAFGYLDGWTPAGDAFYFSGLGQEGDQHFDAPYQENGRVRDHRSNGDHVRLLRYIAGNRVRYVGELRLDANQPWVWLDGPDRVGDVRKIIQFRLLPVGPVLRNPADPVHDPASSTARAMALDEEPIARADLAAATATDVEALKSRTFRQLVAARDGVARRRELELVYAFRDWLLRAHGLDATGLRIPYSPESRDLRADLFIPAACTLVEAKSSASREKIRLAVGQLLDYRRWLDPPPSVCVLTPTVPPLDMLDLLGSLGIGAAWPAKESGFEVRPAHLLGDDARRTAT